MASLIRQRTTSGSGHLNRTTTPRSSPTRVPKPSARVVVVPRPTSKCSAIVRSLGAGHEVVRDIVWLTLAKVTLEPKQTPLVSSLLLWAVGWLTVQSTVSSLKTSVSQAYSACENVDATLVLELLWRRAALGPRGGCRRSTCDMDGVEAWSTGPATTERWEVQCAT